MNKDKENQDTLITPPPKVEKNCFFKMIEKFCCCCCFGTKEEADDIDRTKCHINQRKDSK